MNEVPGLGAVPATWLIERARWLLVRQVRPPRSDDGVVTAFRDGQVTLRANRRLDGFTESIKEIGYQGIRRGDLVVHAMDGFAGAIGVSDSDGKASPVVHAYVASGSVDVRFIAYALRHLATNGYVASLARGIRERSTAFDSATLADVALPAPPVHEQHRIADFLDAETAKMDRIGKIRLAQRVAVEERLVATISDRLLPGILDRRRGEYPWPWLPEPLAEAPMVRLGYVCRLQNGLTVDGGRDPGRDAVTRPYLRVANVQAGWIDLESVAEVTVPRPVVARCTLRPGDVLMTEGGDLDKLGRGTVWHGEIPDCLHQNHVFAIRPDPKRLDSDYLALMTQSLHGRCYFESTGVKTTNLASTNSSKILSFPIPLPGLDVQRRTVATLRAHIEATRRLLRSIDQQATLLAERRQSLITAAVTGQLDPTTARGVG